MTTPSTEKAVRHTPGPWIIVKHGTDMDIETRQDSGMVCCVATAWTRGDRQEANARLIAAAPELLEALSDLMKSCQNWAPTIDCSRARTALPKATGEL